MLRQDQKWIYGVVAGFSFFAALGLGGRMAHSYNALFRLDQTAHARWTQVEQSYEQRMDLTVRMTELVKADTDFDNNVLGDVIAAQDKASEVESGVRNASAVPDDAAVQRFEAAQSGLTRALMRLVETAARYPTLNGKPGFRDTATDLEAVETRIQKNRIGFNEAARAFNAQLDRFPSVLVAVLFRDHRFAAKPILNELSGRPAGLNANAS